MPISPLSARPIAVRAAIAGQPVTSPDRAASADLLTRAATGPRPRRLRRLAGALGPTGWPVAVYSGSRLLLLAVAGLVAMAGHRALAPEFFGFDGRWYLRLAEHGYPAQALHAKSTLGFLPLYPLVILVMAAICLTSAAHAALVTSMVGGLAAAMLVQRLATVWWGEQAARRATVVFCLFPGTVVFSMAYSECLTIPLALGCLLALHGQHWWAAGLLAALATAVEPVALVLVPVCLAAAARQLRARGWHDPAARQSLAAPLLAPLGLGAFAVFLWAWTGTPFASLIAQHYGWHQQSQPLALLALPVARHLIGHPRQMLPYLFTWNIWNGVLGAMVLAVSVRQLVRLRRELTTGALAMTVGIAAITAWSVMTPPNARMLLIAFPAVLVWGRRLSGRGFAALVAAEAVALVFMSALTFAGLMLP